MQAITGIESSFEQFLADKASIFKSPIGANLELIPVCNMDCRMCYVRTDMKEVNRLGGLPDKEMWMRFGREMKEMGTLFVLLTGGEPLLYPHFKEVYAYYHELGFILTVNTNGTLIDEGWAAFFSKYPPRRLNITIYGQDNETYDRLCRNPHGFDQLCHAIKLLQAEKIAIRLNCSLTRYNYPQWDRLREIAKSWNLPIAAAYYMMPPGRKLANIDPANIGRTEGKATTAAYLRQQHNDSRLSPQEAALAAWNILTEKMDDAQKHTYVLEKLKEVDESEPQAYHIGYLCRAGNSSFWVKWDGSFTACGMMGDLEFNIRNESLSILWDKLKQRTENTALAAKCFTCKLRPLCPHCAASEYTENGAFAKEPEYLCHFARSLHKLLLVKQQEYESIL